MGMDLINSSILVLCYIMRDFSLSSAQFSLKIFKVFVVKIETRKKFVFSTYIKSVLNFNIYFHMILKFFIKEKKKKKKKSSIDFFKV
jgi:hypothetical protein